MRYLKNLPDWEPVKMRGPPSLGVVALGITVGAMALGLATLASPTLPLLGDTRRNNSRYVPLPAWLVAPTARDRLANRMHAGLGTVFNWSARRQP